MKIYNLQCCGIFKKNLRLYLIVKGRLRYANMNNISSKIQSELDSLKESMTDEVYKKLCDKLLDIHQEEKQQQRFFEITILVPTMNNTDDDRTFIKNMCMEKRLIKLKLEKANEIIDSVETNGHYELSSCLLNDYVKTNDTVHVHGFCDECEEMDHIDVKIMYPAYVITNILRVY